MFHSVTDQCGRRVALFGLSGNPPTGNCGHRGIVNFLVQTGLFDEVWILPVYQHMYSSKKSMASYEDRVAMCKISMEDTALPTCQVRVLMIEKYAAEYYELKEGKEYRVGTVDIIDYINEQYPGLELNLVLGTDTYKDLIAHKWKNSARILSAVTLHVIERKGEEPHSSHSDSASLAQEPRVVHHSVSWLAEVSSSLVRAISVTCGVDLSDIATSTAKTGSDSSPSSAPALKDLLDARVLDYISQHKLYSSPTESAPKQSQPFTEPAAGVLSATMAPATAPPRATCMRPSRKPAV